jgi:integrase
MVFEKGNKNAENRRVLAKIERYPGPKEIYESIISHKYPYQTNTETSKAKAILLEARDNALAALLFIGAIRISEIERITKQQFSDLEKNPFKLESLKLSKAEKRDRKTGKIITRKSLYRKEIIIPLTGELGNLGKLIRTYLGFLNEKDDRLFKIKNARVEQIIKTKLGLPPHWLRAYGENYLYGLWDNDIIAVANYLSVDPRTLSLYIHRTPKKYLKRLR